MFIRANVIAMLYAPERLTARQVAFRFTTSRDEVLVVFSALRDLGLAVPCDGDTWIRRQCAPPTLSELFLRLRELGFDVTTPLRVVEILN